MLLSAASDPPDRRDASEPEPSEPEPGEVPPAPTGPDAPPREPPLSTPPDLEAEPPGALEVEPPDTPEPFSPETPDISPPEEPDETTPSTPEVSARAEPPPPEPSARPVTETVAASEPEPAKRSLLQRVVLALLVIAAAALIGYVLSRPSGREADADALARSLEAAGRLQLRLETDTPAEARRYVRDEFGWRVGVPVFEAVPLRGVAIAQTAPAVEVPVFLYADAEDRNVAVFAYSYALLDQVPDRLRLTAADYDKLDEGAPFVRRVDGNGVLLWRDRDDIYIAVTDLPPGALADGLATAR